MTVDSEAVREPITRADADVWVEIGRAWRERDYRMLHSLVERVLGMPLAAVDELFDVEELPDDDTANAALESAFGSARTPDGRVLLAFYIYACCLDKWERSAEYERIRRIVRALETVTDSYSADDGRETELLETVAAQATAIEDEMAVESGLNCSCPVETGSRSRRVVDRMDAILGRFDGDGDALTELARSDAETHRRYFEAVANVAAVVERIVDPKRGTPPAATSVIEEIELAETALQGDVYQSELRAHRVTLIELLAAERRPHLHVDRAELVYLYPFGLDGVDPDDVDSLVQTSVSLEAVSDEPIEVHALQVNDLWGRPDRAEHDAGYGGVSIALPRVRVTTTTKDRDSRLLNFEAEVWLSRLGNHFLRVSSKLEDANLHVLNQALRRGSRCMGEEELDSDGRGWRRFMEYADDVIASVAASLGAEAVGDPRANFHVILAARAISVRQAGDDPRPATIEDLEDADTVGTSLLFHPLPGLASALEEWVRYQPPEVGNLLDETRYAGELVARTANTTILYMHSSPEWRTAGYQQMIEFVASVPPLLMLWERQAIAHAERLEQTLGELTVGVAAGELSRLHLEEAGLRKREAEIRQDLGFFHSPALCRDQSQREFIDSLWSAAGVPLLERDVERRLDHLSALQERVSAIAAAVSEQHRREAEERAKQNAQKQRARARRVEIYFQLAGLVLAIASLAELASLVNGGWRKPAPWEIIAGEVGFLVGVSVLALVYILQRLRSEPLDGVPDDK